VDDGTVLIEGGRLVNPDSTVPTEECATGGQCPTRKEFVPRLLGGFLASGADGAAGGKGTKVVFKDQIWIQIPDAMEIELYADCGPLGRTDSYRIIRHRPFDVDQPRVERSLALGQPFRSLHRRLEEGGGGPKKVCVRSSHLVLYGLVVVVASFGSFWLLAPCFKTQKGGDSRYDDDEDDEDDEDEDDDYVRRSPSKTAAVQRQMENQQIQQQQYEMQMQQQQYDQQQYDLQQQQMQYDMQMQQPQQYDPQYQQQYDAQQLQIAQQQQQQQQSGQPFVEHSL